MWKTRSSKYRAQPQISDGIKFPSKKQARQFQELKLLERAGLIKDLQLEVPFVLHGVDGSKICTYRADFVYTMTADGARWVHETKGYRTRDYIIKKKLFLAEYKQFNFAET